ncbi:MAG: hypothetical protein LBD50_03170 [Rickettsiales bacterium]|jgi:hypothetical protein|nr:hypothetical protein [Rickettsiales bacterium]
MMRLFPLFLLGFFNTAIAATGFYPAANADYIKQAVKFKAGCFITNTAAGETAANMEYLLKTIDLCNNGTTQYGQSQYATNDMANTNAVDWCSENLISRDYAPSSDLVITADNMPGDIVLVNSPDITDGGISLTGNNQCLKTESQLNFSDAQAITIEVRFRLLSQNGTPFLFEYSPNWNTYAGGFGVVLNHSGTFSSANEIHTVHNISGAAAAGANNYEVVLNDLQSHTISNTFSGVANPTGRLFYYDGKLIAPSGTYNSGTAIYKPFSSSYQLFIGARDCTSSSPPDIEIQSFRIYKYQLSPAEICKNAWLDYASFGGGVPNC